MCWPYAAKWQNPWSTHLVPNVMQGHGAAMFIPYIQLENPISVVIMPVFRSNPPQAIQPWSRPIFRSSQFVFINHYAGMRYSSSIPNPERHPIFLSLHNLCTPAAFATLSPSTSTHQPSPPLPPSPPTPVSFHPSSISFRISSSKLPGCNQTPLIPSFFASSSTFFVTFGGVIMETDVSVGWGRREREASVG